MVLSHAPDTMRFPSGEIATDITVLVCPRRGAPNVSPVSVSHIWIVPSCEPHAMRFPSGENATENSGQCQWSLFSIRGHFRTQPAATRGVQGNLVANFLNIHDCVGANGRADKYKCGVLCRMVVPNVRTKRWVSLAA